MKFKNNNSNNMKNSSWDTLEDKKQISSIPYYSNLSENVKRIFKRFNITTDFKTNSKKLDELKVEVHRLLKKF